MLPDRDIRPEEWAPLLEALDEKLGGEVLDRGAWQWSQAFFLPSCPPEFATDAFYLDNQGVPVPVDELVKRGREILPTDGAAGRSNPVPVTGRPPSALAAAIVGGLSGRYEGVETAEGFARLKSALGALDPDMKKPAGWLDAIWSVNAHGWPSGYEVAKEWSAQGKNFNPTTFDKDWSDYDPDRPNAIHAGTLYYMAMKRGWADPSPPVLDGGNALGSSANPATVLDEVNKRFAVIEGQGIYDRSRGEFIAKEQFTLLFANRLVNVGAADKPRSLTLDRFWLGSSERAQFCGLELAPGQSQKTASGALNTYRGFRVQPVPGDVEPFLDLTTRLIPDAKERTTFLQFMAFKIQNPAASYRMAAVLWSRLQGVGKNLLTETWANLFDPVHSGVVGQDVFDDQFTEWQQHKLIVIADEVSSVNGRKPANRIKGWITAQHNRINTKGQQKFSEPNRIACVFLSNHADAVFLDETDRRFFVVECTKTIPPRSVFDAFVAWRDSGGASHLLDHMLTLDVTGFNPNAHAPLTVAKREMIEDNKSELERLIGNIMGATNIAALLGRDLVTAEELAHSLGVKLDRQVNATAVAHVLRAMGVERLTRQALIKNGTRPRVYALANAATYQKMTGAALGKVLDQGGLKSL